MHPLPVRDSTIRVAAEHPKASPIDFGDVAGPHVAAVESHSDRGDD